MGADILILDTIKDIIQCLNNGQYEAAGGKLFFLWENIGYEVTDPTVRDQAVELTNIVSAMILGEDPEDPSAELNVYSLGEEGIAEAITCLQSLYRIVQG